MLHFYKIKLQTIIFLNLLFLNTSYASAIFEYVQGALANNPKISAARYKLLASEEGVKTAYNKYYPTIDLDFGLKTRFSKDQYSRTDRPEINSSTQYHSKYAAVSLSWKLYDSGVRKTTLELAKIEVQNYEINYKLVKQALIIQTLKLFTAWEKYSYLEKHYEDLKTIMTYYLDISKDKNSVFRNFLVTDRIQRKIDEYSQKAESVRNFANALSIELHHLTGKKPTPIKEMTASEIAEIRNFFNDLLLEKQLPSLDESIAYLKENNLTLLALKNSVNEENKKIALLIASNGPSVNLVLGSSYNSDRSKYSAHDDTDAARFTGQENSAAVVLNYRLFDKTRSSKYTEAHYQFLAVIDMAAQAEKDLIGQLLSVHANMISTRSTLQKLVTEYQNLKKEISQKFEEGKSQILNSKGKMDPEQNTDAMIEYFNNLEVKIKLISDQNESSFSSLIDYLNLVYDIEKYLELKKH
ncbi:MAG: TolC family protein [Bdellovibrionaceae bacterium]|nr:TolC family protein [Pseudobdellovibrionaceae bacterium]